MKRYELRMTQEEIRSWKGYDIDFNLLLNLGVREIITRVDNPKIYRGKDFNIALPFYSVELDYEQVMNSQEWADELYIIETEMI